MGSQLQPVGFNMAAMLELCRETHSPQPNRRRKTLQTKKATAPNCSLVGILKQKSPHKEQNAERRFLT